MRWQAGCFVANQGLVLFLECHKVLLPREYTASKSILFDFRYSAMRCTVCHRKSFTEGPELTGPGLCKTHRKMLEVNGLELFYQHFKAYRLALKRMGWAVANGALVRVS